MEQEFWGREVREEDNCISNAVLSMILIYGTARGKQGTLMMLLFYLTRILLSSLLDQFTLSGEESYQLYFIPKLPMGACAHTEDDWPSI